MRRSFVPTAFLLFILLVAASASAAVSPEQAKRLVEAERWAAENPQSCALLDDPKTSQLMDGLLLKLAALCGRPDILSQVVQEENEGPSADALGTDVRANDVTGEVGATRTQNETAIARNETAGTLCSGFNDGYSGVILGTDYTGFSRSTDSGATWSDRGTIHPATGQGFGDPALVWRKIDGKFYAATLHTNGIGVWSSSDDCQTLSWIGLAHTSANDDKELMAVDNNVLSPYYGRLYIAWTDFNDARIKVISSANGGTTWSAPVAVSAASVDVQGAWPAVAPNGDVYVAWVRWNPYPSGPINIEVVRSANGGATFAPVTNPLSGGINPQASGPTTTCSRPALNGNIRYLPSPQIAVGPDGALHVVYVRDPDGANTGDVINVYYKRSTDSGATWGSEVQLNDVGTNDQFFPSLSVGATNIVSTAWYDRRDDVPGNLRIRYYRSLSFDGGTTWAPNVEATDVDSPVAVATGLATCYHGDYDQQVQSPSAAILIWGDDRGAEGGSNNADVWTDSVGLAPDFYLGVTPPALSVCAPANAAYTVDVGQVSGFTDPVTLGTSGTPAGATILFGTNPVIPPGSSSLTLGTGAVAAGNYSFDVTGSSTTPTKTVTVGLNVSTAIPGVPALTSPANGALNVPATPTFTWGAVAGASSYSIEVATDAGFTNIVASASGLAAPTWISNVALATSTHHFWRVRATNACGAGVDSSVFDFTTVAAPGDCGPGTIAEIAYQYGFEAGASGWTHSGTGDTWAIATSNPHSGTSQYHAADPTTISDQRLVSPAVVLPAGQNPVVIKFWHVPNLEASGTAACFDGGILEVSTNGGTTWTQVPNANLLVGPYRGTVSSSFSNPLAGLQAWCGVTTYMQTVADISSYAGQTAQFRLRLGSDTSVTRPGWDVDDVVVQSCAVDSMPFLDGFESGGTSQWSLTVP